jgi:hypothetical protein
VKTLFAWFLLVAASLPAVAQERSACAKDADAAGMKTRIDAMDGQVTRIRSLTDRAQQKRLAELHVKHMHEGLRELRRRDVRLDPACRAEVMQSLLEHVIVHQQLVHDLDER